MEALAEDLRMQGIMLSDGHTVARTLSQESAALAAKLAKECAAAVSGKSVSAPPIEVEVHRHSIDLKCGRHFVKVGHAAYAKLAILHRRAMPNEAAPEPAIATNGADTRGSGGDSSPSYAEIDAEVAALRTSTDDRTALHQRMFALLLRYKTLRGHGFHAAIGPAVWRVLRSRLGVGFEGFASPLNCTLPNYCSGFGDVDGAFGAAGSFFRLKPQQMLGGSFALNPPFVHAILDASAERLIEMLDFASSAGADHALSFAFIMPGWKETRAYALLSGSSYMRRAITIAAADHGFCDGASHQRQDPFRASPYDTIVFVLQTDRGAKRWEAHDKFEKELREAMALTVPLASAAERQEKKRKRPLRAREGKEAPNTRKSVKRSSADAPSTPINRVEDLERYKPDIDAWVAAKRSKDFAIADKLRSELREKGIDVEKARPKSGISKVAGHRSGEGGSKKEKHDKQAAEARSTKKRKYERPKKSRDDSD